MNTKNKAGKKRKKVNVIVSFNPRDYEKLKVICDSKFQSKVGYIRMVLLPVLEKDFKEAKKWKK